MNAIPNQPTTEFENLIAREVPIYPSAFGPFAEKLGGFILRYGLVVLLFYFGAYKFTAEEAQGIAPLVTHSPLFGWLQALLGSQGISDVIGSSEIVVALLIGARPFSAGVSAVGSLFAVETFVATLSLLVTTPGVWHFAAGFPVPVPNLAGAFQGLLFTRGIGLDGRGSPAGSRQALLSRVRKGLRAHAICWRQALGLG